MVSRRLLITVCAVLQCWRGVYGLSLFALASTAIAGALACCLYLPPPRGGLAGAGVFASLFFALWRPKSRRGRRGAVGVSVRRRRYVPIAVLGASLFAVTSVAALSLGDPQLAPAGAASAADVTAAPALRAYWVVSRGQTYGSIAARTGVSVPRLIALNPAVDALALRPGQRIRLRALARPRPARAGAMRPR